MALGEKKKKPFVYNYNKKIKRYLGRYEIICIKLPNNASLIYLLRYNLYMVKCTDKWDKFLHIHSST